MPADAVTNQMVAEISRLYAEASPEDQFALRVWMRDIILDRRAGCEHGAGKEERSGWSRHVSDGS